MPAHHELYLALRGRRPKACKGRNRGLHGRGRAASSAMEILGEAICLDTTLREGLAVGYSERPVGGLHPVDWET
jgi:hypothetical protein